MSAGEVFGVILFPVVAIGFNTMAVLIVTGRNPIIAARYSSSTGKWDVLRHKDNLFARLFGYVWASLTLFIDAVVVVEVVKNFLQ